MAKKNTEEKKDAHLKYELGNGGVVHFKRRCRSTVLAKFAEENPEAIDAVVGGIAGKVSVVEITGQLAERVVSGLGAATQEVIIQFLCDRIRRIANLEDDQGTIVDWASMDSEQRIDTIDFYVCSMDIVGMFLSSWLHYQGLGARVSRKTG